MVSPVWLAYVGSRTTRERNARGEGISVYRVDGDRGALQRIQVLGDLVNPSYLALNRHGDRLYAIHGDRSEVSAFVVDPDTGILTLLNQVSCQGRNPVHLALDPTGQYLVVPNHLSGTVAVLPLDAAGALGDVRQLESLPGEPGPHRTEQPFSKPHFCPFDPSGRWVLVPDKGLDRVFSFAFSGGKLTPAAVPWMTSREGSGPRNLVFHPTAPMVYVVNELDSTVTACDFDAGSGTLSARQILPTLPDHFTGHSRAAGIQIDARGQRLYVSNRGHDSVAAFAIDPVSGLLQWAGCTPSLGRTPRFFTPSPDGQWLYVLNEDSDTIVQLAVDPGQGVPGPAARRWDCGSPVCMVFKALAYQ